MNYDALLDENSLLHARSVARAAAAVHRALLVRNWLTGARIVEFEQRGAERAKYGTALLPRLAADLKAAGVRGSSADVLERMRSFYRTYPQLGPAIAAEWPDSSIVAGTQAISATPSRKSTTAIATDSPPPLSATLLFRLSWSHVVELLRIGDPWRRAFYENEAVSARWSVRELQRQVGSLLYERTGLSTDKRELIAAARTAVAGGHVDTTFAGLLRDPYVLEFTGLSERSSYRESDLETALLDHLQAFMLELGTGFCFEARQRRITVGNEHDWIDLVFYHRLLRCHVLLDLKVRAFTHGDAGQMNFYLNWWRDHVVVDGDQPPVGLVLCTDKDETKVHYATAGLDHQLFVSRYQVALPSTDELRRVVEHDRARLATLGGTVAAR